MKVTHHRCTSFKVDQMSAESLVTNPPAVPLNSVIPRTRPCLTLPDLVTSLERACMLVCIPFYIPKTRSFLGAPDAHNCHTQLPQMHEPPIASIPFQLMEENCTPLHFPSCARNLCWIDRSTRVKGRGLASIHDVTCRRDDGLAWTTDAKLQKRSVRRGQYVVPWIYFCTVIKLQ